MWLLFAFIGVPLIEIALFIQVGGAIGLGYTLLIVVLTAILGTYLVRTQGLAALADLQGSFSELRDPTEPLAHGAMILFSGALLLTPGFFTDALGFALLVPGIRSAVFKWARSRVKVTTFSMGAQARQHHPHDPRTAPGDVIDGEFSEVDPSKRPTHPPSGWTKH
ncbi:FxsA family protein [Alisedimentitalea sp. MJ-SS2]|uniref:FxsA family protein n=1 Tax=Aliisedimentitalea sp. MJ-SS2 TaxID=3049795 RepID=UPI00290AD0E9|nr:FxsA family protein [Alisedimentitalea sp. MJ-SS2]MDU8927960.1 FxsA family protein [Alisedimentitalea sp. MJ-SS2]